MANANVWLNIGSMIKFANYAVRKFLVAQPALKMDQNAWHVKMNLDNQAKMVFHVNANHSHTKKFKIKLVNHAMQNIPVLNANQIMTTNVKFVTQTGIGIQLL